METVLLATAVALIAFLYSSVGQAGATGYIAVMSLFGLTQAFIKPTALALNVLVASLAAWQFWRAGHFSWTLFWPFALLSVPLAFLGGYLTLPTRVFSILLGSVLLFSAARLSMKPPPFVVIVPPSRATALSIGAGLGLLSGLTGTGGGVFLAPMLLYRRWAAARTTAAVSALFILVNSVAGLLGNLSSTQAFPGLATVLLVAAGIGGTTGSYVGSHSFSHAASRRVLAIVLAVAGAKLIITR